MVGISFAFFFWAMFLHQERIPCREEPRLRLGHLDPLRSQPQGLAERVSAEALRCARMHLDLRRFRFSWPPHVGGSPITKTS